MDAVSILRKEDDREPVVFSIKTLQMADDVFENGSLDIGLDLSSLVDFTPPEGESLNESAVEATTTEAQEFVPAAESIEADTEVDAATESESEDEAGDKPEAEADGAEVGVEAESKAQAPSEAETRRRMREQAVKRAAAGQARAADRTMATIAYTLKSAAADPARRPLHGTVIGVRPATDQTPVMAEVRLPLYGRTNEQQTVDANILIPYSDFYLRDPISNERRNDSTRDLNQRKLAILSNCIGADVPFILTQVNIIKDSGRVQGYVALASRAEALSRKQRVSFRNRVPGRNIKAGRIYRANILSVERAGHSLWIELGGVETRLLPPQITFRPLMDENDLAKLGYQQGKEIRVYVESVDEEDGNISLRCNARTVELAQIQRNVEQVSVNMITSAQVTSVANDYVRLWIDSKNVPARAWINPGSDNIQPGSKVLVRVVKTDDVNADGISVRCVITRARYSGN